jgi:hypothetical protein
MGDGAFRNKSNDWSSPRDRAGVRLCGGSKFSKSRTSKNALGNALGAPLLIAQSSAHFRESPRWAKDWRAWSIGFA